MVTILHYLGAILLGLVLVQLGLAAVVSVRRLILAGELQEAELQVFRERLAKAQAQRRRVEGDVTPWSGARKFTVSRVVQECEGVKSFYLQPHDQKPIPAFKPGQFLTFQLDVPGHGKKVVRCYSLSDRPQDGCYRVTIKHVTDGVGSGHFHHAVREGSIVDVKAPAGGFFLDLDRDSPVVLIGAGVGLTPLLSMLNEIIHTQPARKVWLFYGVRNTGDHIMKGYLRQVARDHRNVELRTFYSQPGPDDVQGVDYDYAHRLSLEFLRRELPSNNYDFYLCGPGQMMQTMVSGLTTWGVPADHIHKEAFGPASVKKAPVPAGVSVTFAKSNKTLAWSEDAGSLLALAEANGITTIDTSGCHAGSCGTCKTAVMCGKAVYSQEPSSDVEQGSCLTCISVPESDVTLDA